MKKNSQTGNNAALMAGTMASGAGSGIICLPGDSSFVCQLKRIVSSVQGIIFLGFAIFLVYYLINNRKKIF